MIKMKSKKLLILTLLFMISILNSTYSMTVMDASVEELTQESALVIEGKVISKECVWEDNNKQAINTLVKIEVSNYLKGEGPSEITVKQLGGKIGELNDIIIGTPILKEGDKVVLFLVADNNEYVIHSMALGCYKIKTDDNSVEVAVNNLQQVNLINPVTNNREVIKNKIKSFQLNELIIKVESFVD